MGDNERVFTIKLQGKLKKHVKGKVSVKVIGGDLVIDIVSEDKIKYRSIVSDIFPRIEQGCSPDKMSRTIIAEYKRFILTKFFN